MIELQKVCKKFDKHQVLRKINLFIQEGEIFGIIGKSGAGKSTLLRTMNMLERPDSGHVIIDGYDITSLKGRALAAARHKITMIFQSFNLLGTKTVYDNIALPMRIQGIDETAIKTRVEELLAIVELSHKERAWPAELSGGQKQRVAIARALATSPKILLCDEATSALDPATTESILNLLSKINKLYGITIGLITHELEVVKRICHRIALMENGKIVEISAPGTIFDGQTPKLASMFFHQLSPRLPQCIASAIGTTQNNKPLLRLFFRDNNVTTPFISQTSRDLDIDINILLANVDRFENTTCGALVVEITADQKKLQRFLKKCDAAKITVEIEGYVSDDFL